MSQFHDSLPSTGGTTQSFTPDSARPTSHPQVVHNVALVIGGGGAAGNAWVIGIIAGLAEAGLDMTEAADLVIGTSSGATAAAQVRSGIPPTELLASVLSPPMRAVGPNRAAAAVPTDGHGICADEGHWRRRYFGSRSTACDGRVRLGERRRTGTRGGSSGAPWSPPGCLTLNGRSGP